MNSNEIYNKWKTLLEDESLGAIKSKSQGMIMARILENQEKDTKTNSVYKDSDIQAMSAGLIDEAMVAGDQGPSATDMAAGVNSGSAVGVGASVMGLVRRALPSLIAMNGVCGVQPMSAPTSQMFALRALYGGNHVGPEAFRPNSPANTMWSGAGAPGNTAINAANFSANTIAVGTVFSVKGSTPTEAIRYYQVIEEVDATTATTLDDLDIVAILQDPSEDASGTVVGSIVEVGAAMATSVAEQQQGFNGSNPDNNAWNEMSLRIDKATVAAKARQLKAQYSIELAQDMAAVHGMSVDAELNAILANEIVVEINREIIDLINSQSQWGCSGATGGTDQAGVFNLEVGSGDVKGARWAGETYRSLMIQIEKERNIIAFNTGRGKGNFMICSRNVASALAMTTPAITYGAQGMQDKSMNTDTSKSVFGGVLNGDLKIFIDQYAQNDYITIGYKGDSELDAGVFYLPYIPLTPLRSADSRNFQPVLGYKTRYGIAINPFSDPDTAIDSEQVKSLDPANTIGKNCYFRKFLVKGL